MKNHNLRITSVVAHIEHKPSKTRVSAITVWRSSKTNKNIRHRVYKYTPERAFILSRYADESSVTFSPFDILIYWGYFDENILV